MTKQGQKHRQLKKFLVSLLLSGANAVFDFIIYTVKYIQNKIVFFLLEKIHSYDIINNNILLTSSMYLALFSATIHKEGFPMYIYCSHSDSIIIKER